MLCKLKFCEFRPLPNRTDFIAVFVSPFGEEISSFLNAEKKASLEGSLRPGQIGPFNVEPYRKSSGSLGLSVVFPDKLSDKEQF